MLAVIEGVDGSGKQTQTELLYSKLVKNCKVRRLSFPVYDSDTSALVKMYLGGKFGENADHINPYTASSFYAVDRIGSYLADWYKNYKNGDFILCDRYTTSNAVHQASKLSGAEKDKYLDWLFDYEYNILGLPKPDVVVFLDVPPEVSQKLMKDRNNKITGNAEKDIHERDKDFLKHSYENALYVAKKCGWSVVNCVKDGNIRSIDDIGEEVYNLVIGK